MAQYINGQWLKGEGSIFSSKDPATGKIIWEGAQASEKEAQQASEAAEKSFRAWSALSFDKRFEKLKNFQTIVEENRKMLTETLSLDNGKPFWDAENEMSSVISKLGIAVEAYGERCKEINYSTQLGESIVKHRAHGPMAVIAPFNFPMHLPLGHMIPALLAGNTIVLKGSPLTPLITEKMMQCWEQANLNPGVINLVQGGGEVGQTLLKQENLKGILFTGGYAAGLSINKAAANHLGKIVALELGGNNPLVVYKLKNQEEIDAAVYHTINSAYLTAGQRCTCSRRLILIKNASTEKFLEQLIQAIQRIVVGPAMQEPQPFMGPLISEQARDLVLKAYQALCDAPGAKILSPMKPLFDVGYFLSPSLLDVTQVKNRKDEEIFGPLLQVIWVDNMDMAIREANNTAYGLVAGLLGGEPEDFEHFYKEINSGLINWNRPLTGASGRSPFGGIGRSGNFRPAGFYAAEGVTVPAFATHMLDEE